MRQPGLRAILSILVVVTVLAFASYAILSTPGSVNLSRVPSHFTVNGREFGITYVATNQSEREAGLMNREVTNSTTMLFVFPSMGTYSFWMSGVNSSLDIMWLNVTGDVGHVVYFVQDVPGCNSAFACPVYQPSSSANYVIEAKGGFAETNGIGVDTTIQFS